MEKFKKNERVISGSKQPSFDQAAAPLMEYLAKNHHPHTSVYITSGKAELLEGIQTSKGIEDNQG